MRHFKGMIYLVVIGAVTSGVNANTQAGQGEAASALRISTKHCLSSPPLRGRDQPQTQLARDGSCLCCFCICRQ